MTEGDIVSEEPDVPCFVNRNFKLAMFLAAQIGDAGGEDAVVVRGDKLLQE